MRRVNDGGLTGGVCGVCGGGEEAMTTACEA